MSVEPSGGRRSVSPPSSGRSSPASRATRRTVEEGIFKADKILRRYGANIERALATWEVSPEEWADYIAFLGRLLKAIQTHPKDAPILPHSAAISSKLAQCLNPALPSGVHQKALEVYTYIFDTFGSDHISTHLHDYLPGLSAVLYFASLSVRPSLFSLFEDYIVPLPKSALQPILKSLILSVLPALEEDGSEDFERALRILQSFEKRFTAADNDAKQDQDGFFWQCLFLAVITSSSRRQGALNYLTRRLPVIADTSRLSSNPESEDSTTKLSAAAEIVVTPEPGLLIRCFVCGLADSNMLTQRGFLDLLVTNLPLSSAILQERAGNGDLDRLVSAATQVLLRKDMSLNRRLWSWFLGPESKEANGKDHKSPKTERKDSIGSIPGTQWKYFSRYGMASLERCILKMLNDTSESASGKALPFRICLSLMDRWEIGGLLVPRIFLPAMRSIYEYSLIASRASTTEIIRSANLFFDGVEASLIWESLLDSIQATFEHKEATKDGIKLSRWTIENFNVKDEEMLTLHIPNISLYILSMLNSTGRSYPLSKLENEALELTSKLLALVPARTFQDRGNPSDGTSVSRRGKLLDSNSSAMAILDFYKAHVQSGSRTNPQLSHSELALLIQDNVSRIMTKALEVADAAAYSRSADVFVGMLSKALSVYPPSALELHNALTHTFDHSREGSQIVPFPILSSTVSVIHHLQQNQFATKQLDGTFLADLEAAIVAQAWNYLSPSNPKYHVEVVKLLWQLESLVDAADVFLDCLSDLTRPRGSQQSLPEVDTVRKFGILWNHSIQSRVVGTASGRRISSAVTQVDESQAAHQQQALQRPLMLVLNWLNNKDSQEFEVVVSWLHQLQSLETVFQILLNQLGDLIDGDGLKSCPDRYRSGRYRDDQFRELRYIFGHFLNILKSGNTWTWQTLKNMPLMKDREDAHNDNGLIYLAQSCILFLCSDIHSSQELNLRLLDLLEVMLNGPVSASLKQLELDSALLDKLLISVSGDSNYLQGRLLRLASQAFKLGATHVATEEARPQSALSVKNPATMPMSPTTTSSANGFSSAPATKLVKCLRAGFSSVSARPYLDHWLAFFTNVLPNFGDVLFANLLPLVECLCTSLDRAHEELITASVVGDDLESIAPEACIVGLLDALELLLDRSYDLLLKELDVEPTAKANEPTHNFLSSVTSSVFKTESAPARSTKTNSRLTVILSFQDAIRVCLKMWLWATRPSEKIDFDNTSLATTTYNAIKVRNKTRHLLEQIYSVEPLESLEVIISYWCNSATDAEAAGGLSLLHVMQVTKPKHVVPAILDAICSRTNPSALTANRVSSQTMDLSASEVATFYSAYLSSTEDDAIDEIWQECISFCRDVLANPLPHRSILPHLLSIIQLLAEKMNNTNFGEQRKMRRDLGDIFQRILIASFTTLPSNYISEHADDGAKSNAKVTRKLGLEQSMGLIMVLNRATSQLDLILETTERTGVAVNNIAAHLISSLFHAKSFPKNISVNVLTLVTLMGQKAPTTRYWKKEIADAFNDSKFLASPPSLVIDGWFPALHQWSLHEKDRMPELLSRLTPPTSAGIMFGVGANAARIEADRKTQMNLRRICFLLLASPDDTYSSHLRSMEEKLVELFEASPSSSPSTTIKAELFMLWRTLALKVASTHLIPMWPIINDKLQLALTSILPNSTDSNDFNNLSLLQACKLLGTLLTLSPDEFQLHQWLYVTDTIDAVYATSDWSPTAISDQIADALGSHGIDDSQEIITPVTSSRGRQRRMLLNDDLTIDKDDIKALPREEFVRTVLRPYLSQLSIQTYESVYGADVLNPNSVKESLQKLKDDLLADLLDTNSITE